jgi:hypothetical protein
MRTIRQMLVLLAGLALFNACATKEAEAPKEEPVTKPAVTLPYVAGYSSSFEMGNPEYARTILQGSWKDWEENKLDNMTSWLSDTVVAFHSDNRQYRGAQTLMTEWKKNRLKYSKVQTTIDAVMPVYSTDKKEDWVLVWATEIDTNVDGKTDTVSLMETWRINKEGKADLLLQYERRKPK